MYPRPISFLKAAVLVVLVVTLGGCSNLSSDHENAQPAARDRHIDGVYADFSGGRVGHVPHRSFGLCIRRRWEAHARYRKGLKRAIRPGDRGRTSLCRQASQQRDRLAESVKRARPVLLLAMV